MYGDFVYVGCTYGGQSFLRKGLAFTLWGLGKFRSTVFRVWSTKYLSHKKLPPPKNLELASA